MFKRALVVCVLLLLIIGSHSDAAPVERVLSLSPAATEILYDLGLGDRVAAVTQWCDWPPEAREKQLIGDMMKVDLETVASISPDLVVLSTMNGELERPISSFGYRVAVVSQDSFEDIVASIVLVGDACGVGERARERVAELIAETNDAYSLAERADPPRRVLTVVSRGADDGGLSVIYAAGRSSFYSSIIEGLGAVNALESDAPYVRLTREGLERLDPDVVIELCGSHGASAEDAAADWRALTDLRAAAEGRVGIITGTFALRQGPRYPMIVRAFASVLNGAERADEADPISRELLQNSKFNTILSLGCRHCLPRGLGARSPQGLLHRFPRSGLQPRRARQASAPPRLTALKNEGLDQDLE